MPNVQAHRLSAEEIARELEQFIERASTRAGSTKALRPAHRVKFHWPPHPISYSYHVLASDWKGRTRLEAHGESFEVILARTPYGVFGKCEELWLEARGETEEEMLAEMAKLAEPLFRRQQIIGKTLELDKRFSGSVRELSPVGLLKLLYCEDRDVAHEAQVAIETQYSDPRMMPGLLIVLRDRKHPWRRSAQWCVLDLFEALSSFCGGPEDEAAAVEAMKGVIWDAEDDYARTVYKAGVVLGGHLPHNVGGNVLLECLKAPSPIGRRSAIHGLFHVVEWAPETKDRVLTALDEVSQQDASLQLREYAAAMRIDIQDENMDHASEPIFPDEP